MGTALQTARFQVTVAKRHQIPPETVPEIAFAGRSNSGKSSAINRLCQRRKLAFASKTPGRTQALNYFALGPTDASPHAFLVDTPGYGYASVPLAVKQDWQGLAGWYLRERRSLAGVVLMLDCRRQLTQMDADLLGWVPPDIPRLILVTKADKLKKQAQRKTLGQIQDTYQALFPDTAAVFMLFSSLNGQGVDEARGLIDEWLEMAGHPVEADRASTATPAAGTPAEETANAGNRHTTQKPGKASSDPPAPRPKAGTRRSRTKKNPMKASPGSKPVNRGARSGRRSGR